MNNPKIHTFIFLQVFAVLANVILSSTASYFLIKYLAMDSMLANIITSVISTTILFHILNPLGIFVIGLFLYRGEWDTMQKDIDSLSSKDQKKEDGPVELQFTIVETPENPLGKFMGENFYEWLDLKADSGEITRVFFDGTSEACPPLRNDQIFFQPGFLYTTKKQ